MILSALLLAAAAPAAQPAAQPEVTVPRFRAEGFVRYVKDGERGLWVQSIQGRWVYARFISRCARLPAASSVGFETSSFGGQLDRYSVVTAEGQRCRLASLTAGEPPAR